MSWSLKTVCLLSAVAALATAAAPRYPLTQEDARLSASLRKALLRRASPDAPDEYTPANTSCPSTRPTIRSATSLSPQEEAWLPRRRNNTIPSIRGLLSRNAIPGFDADAYLEGVETDATALPNIGIAISGGGYRAMLNGAGALAAWDERTVNSTGEGHLGGLLQSATYLSALSGGGWLVGSLYLNNHTYVQEITSEGRIWQLENSILYGPEDINLASYYNDVFDAVSEKSDAGFERSITDYWGRMLSFQLIDDDEGGISYTFSSIAESSTFRDGEVPLPLIVADGRYPGEVIIPTNATIYEFTPWELGSFDRTLRGFVPLEFVGSDFEGGSLADGNPCVRGFDNAGFVMGTSSSLFNQIVLYIKDDSSLVPDAIPDWVLDSVVSVLDSFGEDNDDIADWSPNPFFEFNVETNLNAPEKRLTLVDGGEDLQNVPYHPLILNDRRVDVIFSLDSSADTKYFWPNGASAVATYERQLDPIAEGTSFPAVPGKDTFLNLGLNTRPTFFGCNSTNTTEPAPLVVYIPSYPYVYWANISTFTNSINNTVRNAMIQNGYDVVTMANATRDPEWPTCVSCAVMHRSFERTGADVPEACARCFERYCWDGTVDESEPATYEPEPFGTVLELDSGVGKIGGMGMTVTFLAMMFWAL